MVSVTLAKVLKKTFDSFYKEHNERRDKESSAQGPHSRTCSELSVFMLRRNYAVVSVALAKVMKNPLVVFIGSIMRERL